MNVKEETSSDVRQCGNCAHYRQHYIEFPVPGDGYRPCHSGHCRCPRPLLVYANQVCGRFRPKGEENIPNSPLIF